MEQVQTDLPAVPTERHTFIRKVCHYRVRVHNMDYNNKRTAVTTSALAKRGQEREMENEEQRTENISIFKLSDDLVTKRIHASLSSVRQN